MTLTIDYINGYIDDCVDEVRERLGLDQINLLGICQGGTFSLCYAALYPEKGQKPDYHGGAGRLSRARRIAEPVGKGAALGPGI